MKLKQPKGIKYIDVHIPKCVHQFASGNYNGDAE